MNLNKELGLQSWSLRGFKKHEDVIRLVKEAGLSTIELCGFHVDFKDEKQFDDVISLYKKQGITISSIGVERFEADEAFDTKRFEFAKLAGCKCITADFKPETSPQSFKVAEKLAEKFNINIAIHNHGGYHWLGSSQMLRHIMNTTGPRIGLGIDTAWAIAAREDPLKIIEEFKDRVYGLHIKDFIFDRAGKPSDVVVGTGNLDLKGLVALLQKINFKGSAILEYEGDVQNPMPAIKKCVEEIHNALATSNQKAAVPA
jgi:inosose dehydratase